MFDDEVEDTKEYWAVSYCWDLANKIGQLLDRKGWSQTKLAKELGVSRQRISAVLNGRQNMTASQIAHICFVLGKDPRTLFDNPTQVSSDGAGLEQAVDGQEKKGQSDFPLSPSPAQKRDHRRDHRGPPNRPKQTQSVPKSKVSKPR